MPIHKIIKGGEEYLPFALAQERKLRATGVPYISKAYEIGDVSINVKLEGEHSHIRIEKEEQGGYLTLPHSDLFTEGVTAKGTPPTPVAPTAIVKVTADKTKVKENTAGISATSVWYGAPKKDDGTGESIVRFTPFAPQGFALFGHANSTSSGFDYLRENGRFILSGGGKYRPTHDVIAACIATSPDKAKSALIYATYEEVRVDDPPYSPPASGWVWVPTAVKVTIWVVNRNVVFPAAPEAYAALEFTLPQEVSYTDKETRTDTAYGSDARVETRYLITSDVVNRYSKVVTAAFSESGKRLGVMLMPGQGFVRTNGSGQGENQKSRLYKSVLAEFDVAVDNYTGVVTAAYIGFRDLCGGFTYNSVEHTWPKPPPDWDEGEVEWVGPGDYYYPSVNTTFTADTPITFGYRGELPVPVFFRRNYSRQSNGRSHYARFDIGGNTLSSPGTTFSNLSTTDTVSLMFGATPVWSESALTTIASTSSRTYSLFAWDGPPEMPGSIPRYIVTEENTQDESTEDIGIGITGVDVRFNQALLTYVKRKVTNNYAAYDTRQSPDYWAAYGMPPAPTSSGPIPPKKYHAEQWVVAVKGAFSYKHSVKTYGEVSVTDPKYILGNAYPFASVALVTPTVTGLLAYSKVNQSLFVSRNKDTALLCVDDTCKPYQAAVVDKSRYLNAKVVSGKVTDIRTKFSVAGGGFSMSPVTVIS